MEPPSTGLIYYQIVAFVMLFPFSILFSGSESAFMSLTQKDIDRMAESESKIERKIANLLKSSSDQLLITFLLGNNLVNVTIAILAHSISSHFNQTLHIPETWVTVIDVLFVGTMILLIGEIIPKLFAISNNVRFCKFVYAPISLFMAIFYPITFVINKMVKLIDLKGGKGLSKGAAINLKAIGAIIETDGAEGLEEDEQQMINQIMEFGDKNAKDIMVPRVDMKAVPEDITINELIAFFEEYGFSRIPVYNENIDNIIGILYIKDLLSYLDMRNEKIELKRVLREVTFIPESKDIGDLLRMFQKEKIHFAVVVDEYGGTSGMITLEDIIEEIVGEIQDEFDDDEKLYKEIEEGVYEFDAKIPIDDVNEILKIELPEDEDFESLGGFLYYIFGEVPDVGDKKYHDNLIFTILSLEKQRIGWVRVEVKDKESENEN
ncbi:MAG: hypothetical protein CR982_06695 [Candidatus Cloacimonadota bacterium]|nr:MAG: hypothetical protein CR982_06695 [Candidatus Cloacimonadota bacterium]PIE77829.1 MAG: hypothetical protein CSA15_11070 [Candidatus Delongbacteria bacterium]